MIVATDADVDGMHIRNLLLTYFLHYFEELVHQGAPLHPGDSPVPRPQQARITRYCYSEEPSATSGSMEELRGPEVTRFKGLGEISPGEFGQFINEGIRLVPVALTDMSEVGRCLEFFMGKNTPERRSFIMDNLLHDVV